MSSTHDLRTLIIGTTAYQTTLTKKFELRKQYVQPDLRKIHCVIPGLVQKIYVQKGARIARNQPVVMLEAMKMQNDLLSPVEGKVKQIHVNAGQMVAKGQLLIELE